MIRKLKLGEYRLYSRKKDAKTGKRRSLGTFSTREKAEAHERERCSTSSARAELESLPTPITSGVLSAIVLTSTAFGARNLFF